MRIESDIGRLAREAISNLQMREAYRAVDGLRVCALISTRLVLSPEGVACCRDSDNGALTDSAGLFLALFDTQVDLIDASRSVRTTGKLPSRERMHADTSPGQQFSGAAFHTLARKGALRKRD